jgi:DNA-binding CsgD family transcriptional regulator
MNINENIMNFNKSSGNIINKKTKIKLNINEITKNMNKNKIQKKIEIKNNSKEEEDDTFQK